MENDFEDATRLVEETIRALGLDPATTRAETNDLHASWTLKRGSASLLVAVTKQVAEDTTYLRVAAPVVTLPTDASKHPALYRRLLELNAGGLANAAFGLIGERVVAVSERPARGLDAHETQQIITHLAAVADTFDDRLEKEFGAGPA